MVRLACACTRLRIANQNSRGEFLSIISTRVHIGICLECGQARDLMQWSPVHPGIINYDSDNVSDQRLELQPLIRRSANYLCPVPAHPREK